MQGKFCLRPYMKREMLMLMSSQVPEKLETRYWIANVIWITKGIRGKKCKKKEKEKKNKEEFSLLYWVKAQTFFKGI